MNEGDIYENEQGQRVILKNNEWVPVLALDPKTKEPVTDYQDLFANKAPLTTPQTIAGGLAALNEGAMLGFGDEVGGLGGLGPQALTEGAAGGEQIRQRFAQENPMTNMGLEIAGTLINPLTRKAGAKMIASRPFVGGAAAGAGFGGAFGAGKAQEGERLQGAGGGAAVGGLLGGPLSYLGSMATQKALPAIQNLLGKTKQVTQPAMSTAQQQADDIIRPTFQKSFGNVDEALTQAQKLGPKGLIADMSPELAGFTNAAVNREIGGLKSSMTKAFMDRSKGGVNRIISKLNLTAGNKGKSLAQAYKEVTKGISKQTSDLFDSAREQVVDPADVTRYAQYLDDQIKLTENTNYSGAFKQAKNALFNGKGKEATIKTSVEQLDFARRNLADRASEAFRKGRMDEWRILKDARNQFDDMMPQSYREAWASASEGRHIINAADAGEKFFLPSNKTSDFLEWVSSATDAEKRAYTMSMIKAAKEKMGNITDGGKVSRLFNTPNVREKLTALIGNPGRTSEFIADIERENLFKATQNLVVGNSFTAARQEAGKLLDNAFKLAQANAPTSRDQVWQALGQKVLSTLRLETSLSKDVAKALESRLTTQGVTPETVRMLMATPARESFKRAMVDFSPTAAQIGEIGLGTQAPGVADALFN